jgi:hypothetical protein
MKSRKTQVTELPRALGNAIDCPDGLARCVGGAVESSRLARIPLPCTKSESSEGCVCPWDSVGECSNGCAAEGVTLVIEPDRALARLCAPDPNKPPSSRAAPMAVAPPGACQGQAEGEGYRCTASLVLACTGGGEAGSARVLAACLRGCAHDGDVLGLDEADPERASRILCAP